MRINKKLALLNGVTKNGKIFINSVEEPGGYKVKNYEDLMRALDYLGKEEWNKNDDGRIRDIIRIHGFEDDQRLNRNEFDWLKSYVTELNKTYPYYYSIISTQIHKEDEKSLSVLIPTDIQSFEELIAFNKRLAKAFDSIKITEDISFSGFDKGTDWIVLTANTITAYYLIMTCLNVAQKVVTLKKTYHEGEIAKLQHQALIKEEPDLNLTEDKFKEITIQSFTEDNIRKLFTSEALSKLQRHGTENELLTGVKKAMPELIDLLEKGMRIEPANEHPKFLTTENGNILINVNTYITYGDSNDESSKESLSLESGEDNIENDEIE
jgi:hypothetical protein